MLLGVNKREDKIRVDRITHDIYVLDTLIYFIEKYNIAFTDIESEKDLHIKDGFGIRKHQPDFVFTANSIKHAIEIELNQKATQRLESNIRDNYLRFDYQTWITNNNKVFAMLQNFKNEYSNIEIIRLEEVIKYVRE